MVFDRRVTSSYSGALLPLLTGALLLLLTGAF